MLTRQQIVYLVGPISGCSYRGCTEWRNKVKEDLEAVKQHPKMPYLYHCLTPMRGKEHLEGTGKVLTATIERDADPFNNAEYREVSRDFFDVQRADVILFNLEPGGEQPSRVSIGTMFEMAWAHVLRKFSVTIMTKGNIHEHLYPKMTSCAIVSSLDEAITYLAGI